MLIVDLPPNVIQQILSKVHNVQDMFSLYCSCKYFKDVFQNNIIDVYILLLKQSDIGVINIMPTLKRLHIHRKYNLQFDLKWCERRDYQYIYLNSIHKISKIPHHIPILYGFHRLTPVDKPKKKKNDMLLEPPTWIDIKEYFINRFESKRTYHRRWTGTISQSI